MGGGGLGGLLTPYFGQNLFNRNIDDSGQRVVANLLDPSGGSSFTTLNAAEQTGATSGGRTPTQIASGEELPPKPIEPPDPAIAQAQATEDARQAELDKRRKRARTLLTQQEETGTATVGTKTLLGG